MISRTTLSQLKVCACLRMRENARTGQICHFVPVERANGCVCKIKNAFLLMKFAMEKMIVLMTLMRTKVSVKISGHARNTTHI